MVCLQSPLSVLELSKLCDPVGLELLMRPDHNVQCSERRQLCRDRQGHRRCDRRCARRARTRTRLTMATIRSAAKAQPTMRALRASARVKYGARRCPERALDWRSVRGCRTSTAQTSSSRMQAWRWTNHSLTAPVLASLASTLTLAPKTAVRSRVCANAASTRAGSTTRCRSTVPVDRNGPFLATTLMILM